jgi:hypothetical protein
VHLGLDVARHRDVHEEEGPALAHAHGALDHVALHDRGAARGARDDDVRSPDLLLELVPGDGRCVHLAGKGRGAVEAPVADAQRARVLAQAARRGLRHLARAQQEDDALVQIAEDVPSQVDRDARDTHRAGADGRLRAHPLRGRERPAHAATEHALERPGGDGGVVRLLHLSEDLRLAEHHRVEARGDAEDVLHGLVPLPLVQVRFERGGVGNPAVPGELLADRAAGLDHRAIALLAREREDLDAIARRQEHRLRQLRAIRQPREHRREHVAAGREALAHLDGGRSVREADDENQDPACPTESATDALAATSRSR